MNNWDFNNIACKFNVIFSRVGGKEDEAVIITNDKIIEVDICTDIVAHAPILTISLTDEYSSIMPNYADDGNTIITVQYEVDDRKLLHNFVLTNQNLVNYKTQENKYILECHSVLYSILNSKIIYSTGHNNISHIECADQILHTNFKDFYTPIPDDMPLPNKVQPYISPTNESLTNSINNHLLFAANSDTGLYITSYNIMKEKLSIVNINKLLVEDDFKKYNMAHLPSKYGSDDSANYIYDFNKYNHISKTDADILKLKNINISKFDQTSRTWSSDDYAKKRSFKFLPKQVKTSTYQSNADFIEDLNKIGGVRDTLQTPRTEHYHNKRLIKWFRTHNIAQFRCKGICERNAGELFVIGVDNAEQPLFKEYAGKWLMSRVHHIFKVNTKQYTNDISVIRSDSIPRNGGVFDAK